MPAKSFFYPVVQMFIIPALLILVYAASASWFFPPGVNHDFALTLLRVAAVTLAACLFWLLLVLRRQTPPGIQQPQALRSVDFYLLLLPLGPIVQYLILNADVLSFLDISLLFVLFAFGALLTVVAIPHWVSRISSRPITFAAAATTCFLFLNMAALSRTFSWHLEGNSYIQMTVFAFVFVVITLLYQREPKLLSTLNILLFTATSIQALFSGQLQQPQAPAPEPVKLVEHTPSTTPDIFLLTYDGYVENETMLQYGIDNSAQEQWLQDHGFTLYPGTYSVASVTLETMGRLFAGENQLRLATAGKSAFFDQLALAGYETYGIFTNDYFFQGVGGQYDHNFPTAASAAYSLALAILEGEFRFNAHFDTPSQAQFEQQKRGVMKTPTTHPKFLYTHTGPGHSQNSGACRANETELFRQRLLDANKEMQTDITTLLKHHPRALIIVNGDHGPTLTKTCYNIADPTTVTRLDLQDRFGTFLAVRWPQPPTPAAKIQRLQDLTQVLLQYLYPGEPFEEYRSANELITRQERVGGVNVIDGIITRGVHKGEPLFQGVDTSSVERSNK